MLGSQTGFLGLWRTKIPNQRRARLILVMSGYRTFSARWSAALCQGSSEGHPLPQGSALTSQGATEVCSPMDLDEGPVASPLVLREARSRRLV